MLDKSKLTEDLTTSDPLEAKDARLRLKAYFADFLDKSFEASLSGSEEEQPTFGLKVPAGLGKTRTALECIAATGERFLKHGHILFYVPTLELAEDAHKDFEKLNSGLPSMVLRGRGATNPADQKPMCERHRLADKLAGKVRSITKALCIQETSDGVSEAECYSVCAYFDQVASDKHKVIFLPHAYLTKMLPSKRAVALRIIDEKFWSELTETQVLSYDDWFTLPDHIGKGSMGEIFKTVRLCIFEALEAGRPVQTALRENGVSTHDLERLSKAERKALPKLDLRPGEPDNVLDHNISKHDLLAAAGSHKRALVFELLVETADKDSTERLSLQSPNARLAQKGAIKTHLMHDLPRNAPIILLDADLNEVIAAQICPGMEIKRLNVLPRAEIVQITKNTLSTHSLTTEKDAATRREYVLEVLKHEVAKAGKGKVLAVATKKVLAALFKQAGGQFCEEAPEPLTLHGATIRWFGPKMLGINKFANYATIVVIGRLQPTVMAVEDDMRALFGDSTEKLLFSDTQQLVEARKDVPMQSAQDQTGTVRVHPDPRGQQVLEQMREAQTEQAIARLRLIDADPPKRVVILSDLPLAGLPVTKRVSLKKLAQEARGMQRSQKYKQLRNAITGGASVDLQGLRLSSLGLFQDAPVVFPSEQKAKSFLRNFARDDVLLHLKQIASDLNKDITPLTLRRAKSGGKPVYAVVFTPESSAIALANTLWPGMFAQMFSWSAQQQDDEVIEDA